MPSSTTSVSGSDAARSSPTPSLQSQSSLVESPCKCGSSKPDSPKIALEIPEDQDDVFSDAIESVFEDEYPSIQFKAFVHDNTSESIIVSIRNQTTAKTFTATGKQSSIASVF
ncbi:hypothetical protein FOBRF1_003201 [Fusarium oxysporum]